MRKQMVQRCNRNLSSCQSHQSNSPPNLDLIYKRWRWPQKRDTESDRTTPRDGVAGKHTEQQNKYSDQHSLRTITTVFLQRSHSAEKSADYSTGAASPSVTILYMFIILVFLF